MAARFSYPRAVRRLILAVTVPAAAAVAIQDNLYEITPVTGTSMSPTLSPDYNLTGRCDRVLWSKVSPSANLVRGELVTYRSPQRPDRTAVKRVVALEGDTVILDPRRRPGGVDRSSGREEADRTQAESWDQMGPKFEVPFGHVWVEGDNWRSSNDSNNFGPISKSLIIGHAPTIVYPWERMGTKPWEDRRRIGTRVVYGKQGVPPEGFRDMFE
ncbi:hypothetical protein B0A48_11930 [Cryoendolithus antarcticus]|uniref:Mitochondrial inner membrane protease subunit n=1 Tax=Cryoendolithus antarcticus TaxID=1507870 RepID=A0A1V8STA3_9PEZI|nr:hypothetical protein B0A48_11930 [Cryoendolithus antarcticus]OQO16407.1 hypothetical protein B0A51_15012 [Rachicladosporium sp. CCFEE 5018]OQO17770.1 hypothetical protein B0A51_14844 [Rachicladosporium sp. CCFEE 5018]